MKQEGAGGGVRGQRKELEGVAGSRRELETQERAGASRREPEGAYFKLCETFLAPAVYLAQILRWGGGGGWVGRNICGL